MKYYKNYTAKKFKLPKRILFFLACAVIIFAAAILLGNHLKNRLANAEIDTSPVTEEGTTAIAENPEGGGARHDGAAANINAAYLDLTGADAVQAGERVTALSAAGAKGFSFVAAGTGGLTYASPAAQQLARLQANSGLVSAAALESAVARAHALGMRASAVLSADNARIDALIAGELSALGFNEIIITGFENILGEDGGEISSAVAYLEEIRSTATTTDISMSLLPAAYIHARNSYQIEKLFAYTEFMTIDLRGYDKQTAADTVQQLAGSFRSYFMRALLNGNDTQAASALAENSVSGIQYVTAPPPVPADTTGGV